MHSINASVIERWGMLEWAFPVQQMGILLSTMRCKAFSGTK